MDIFRECSIPRLGQTVKPSFNLSKNLILKRELLTVNYVLQHNSMVLRLINNKWKVTKISTGNIEY